MCSQVTNKSLSLSAPFVQELDELWQAGLSGSDAHGSPDQSTAMFDRDAVKVPGGSSERGVTKPRHLRLERLHSAKFLNGAHGLTRGISGWTVPSTQSDNVSVSSLLDITRYHTVSFRWHFFTGCSLLIHLVSSQFQTTVGYIVAIY